MKAKIQNTDQSLKEKEMLPFLSSSLGTSKRFRYDDKKANPGPCEYEIKGQFGTERNKCNLHKKLSLNFSFGESRENLPDLVTVCRSSPGVGKYKLPP